MAMTVDLRGRIIEVERSMEEQCATKLTPPSTAPIHDYAAKLKQPGVFDGVKRALRAFESTVPGISLVEALRCRHAHTPGPVSVNVDLTVACNYSCPHCIDGPLLNTGKRLDELVLARSLIVLRLAGLRSVILIGGGEPTLHPKFREVVKIIKLLGLQCAIVSNGSRNSQLCEIAPLLTAGDWIRLSLDAATEKTFRVMHLPNKASLTLDEICTSAGEIKRANPKISLGFSYIVTWRGASVYGQSVLDNSGELADAARLAKRSGFDFIAFKPLLDRDEIGAEMITIGGPSRAASQHEALLRRIKADVEAAKLTEDDTFKVFSSLNLQSLIEASQMDKLRSQPRRCHMRLFRQVVTPSGVFGCPVYRASEKDRVGGLSAYASIENFFLSRRQTGELVEEFDAGQECRNVACLYNSTNWWLQGLRDGTETSGSIAAVSDFFL
jgi:hypothetical protein